MVIVISVSTPVIVWTEHKARFERIREGVPFLVDTATKGCRGERETTVEKTEGSDKRTRDSVK